LLFLDSCAIGAYQHRDRPERHRRPLIKTGRAGPAKLLATTISARLTIKGGNLMKFQEIKVALAHLEAQDLRRLVLEVLPALWPQIVADEACVQLLRQLVDEASVKQYQDEHTDHL
jgi:hypothetical protein